MNKASDDLRNLSNTIANGVKEAVSNHRVEPEQEPFFQWKVKNFQYTDKAIPHRTYSSVFKSGK